MASNNQFKNWFNYVAMDIDFGEHEGYSSFLKFLYDIRYFNHKTFGDFTLEEKANSLVKHIRSECDEIEENPTDLDEWIDVVILAMDALLRAEAPHQVLRRWASKMATNASRDWPKPTADNPMFHIKD